MNQEWVDKLSNFSRESGDCHKVDKDDIIKHAIVALEKQSDEIASYVSFSILKETLSRMSNIKSFVKDYIDKYGDV
jgi:hypothetical protein